MIRRSSEFCMHIQHHAASSGVGTCRQSHICRRQSQKPVDRVQHTNSALVGFTSSMISP